MGFDSGGQAAQLGANLIEPGSDAAAVAAAAHGLRGNLGATLFAALRNTSAAAPRAQSPSAGAGTSWAPGGAPPLPVTL